MPSIFCLRTHNGLEGNHAYGRKTYSRSSCLYVVSKEAIDSEKCKSQSRMKDTNIVFCWNRLVLILGPPRRNPSYPPGRVNPTYQGSDHQDEMTFTSVRVIMLSYSRHFLDSSSHLSVASWSSPTEHCPGKAPGPYLNRRQSLNVNLSTSFTESSNNSISTHL